MQQNNTANSCPTTMSPFNLPAQTGVLVHSPFSVEYTMKDHVTVSKLTFFKRLNQELGDLFDSPFDWKNIYLAGGFISGLMEYNYNPKLYEESDVDMFICAETHGQLVDRMNYVINYISQKTPNVHFITVGLPSVMVIDCVIQGWKRRLQLVGSDGRPGSIPKIQVSRCPTAFDIIHGFDLTHCQIAFNGEDIICTPEFIHSMITRQTSINPSVGSIHAYRLVKAYFRGFSISNPKKPVYIKNCYHQYGDDRTPTSGMPKNTDKLRDITHLNEDFAELLTNPIVQKNLHKNFIIDFSAPFEERMKFIDTHTDYSQSVNVYSKGGECIFARYSEKNRDMANSEKSPMINTRDLNSTISNMGVTGVLTRQ